MGVQRHVDVSDTDFEFPCILASDGNLCKLSFLEPDVSDIDHL